MEYNLQMRFSMIGNPANCGQTENEFALSISVPAGTRMFIFASESDRRAAHTENFGD